MFPYFMLFLQEDILLITDSLWTVPTPCSDDFFSGVRIIVLQGYSVHIQSQTGVVVNYYIVLQKEQIV